TAQKLWHSRFGQYTSLRLAPLPLALREREDEGEGKAKLEALEQHVRQHFFDKDWLPLESLGLRFQPVKAQGLSAGMTAESFGWLFLGFSFFLIASAAMLVGLLFRLGI